VGCFGIRVSSDFLRMIVISGNWDQHEDGRPLITVTPPSMNFQLCQET
jgi:hypothetical protein